MSTLKLSGATSGSSIIKAPDSGSTGVTFTLPASAGTLAKTTDITGGATGVDFNDNVKIRLGTGNDLEIYHSGSSSYIKDVGTGSLQLLGSTNVNILNGADTEYCAKFITDGAVELYHNNAKKLETTSEGITVTGNTIISEGSSFKFGGNNARIMGHSGNNRIQFLAAGYEQMRLQNGQFRVGNVEASQDDGKLSVSEAKNYSSGIARQQINVRDTQAYSVTDNGGAIAFSGKYNNGGSYTTLAQIEGVKANNTDGNYQGGLKFATRSNGSSMDTRGRWDADGIKFGSDTAAANGLSDYEEGTYDAVVTADSGTITVESGSNMCFYTKIGRTVTCGGRIEIASVSNPSGQLRVSLPFNMANLGEGSAMNAVTVNLYNLSSDIIGICAEASDTNKFLIRSNSGRTANVAAIANLIDADSLIGFTATYITP